MTAGCGLFGKIHARRDFVARNVPQSFLAVWEPWIQQGLARSRADLGEDWLSLFLTTPIWSFRLGAAVCGVEVVGAIMPSMDAAGRCFPLTLVACGDDGRTFAPDADAAAAWYAAAAAFLLTTLDPAVGYPQILDDLDRLACPADAPETSPADAASQWWTEGGEASAPDEIAADGLPEPSFMTRMIGRRIGAEAVAGHGSAS